MWELQEDEADTAGLILPLLLTNNLRIGRHPDQPFKRSFGNKHRLDHARCRTRRPSTRSLLRWSLQLQPTATERPYVTGVLRGLRCTRTGSKLLKEHT